MAILSDDEKQDFWSSIADAGFPKKDFDLTEIEDRPSTAAYYALSGKAVVRRISTGVMRQYSAGHATSWPADFEADLRGGFFGAA